MGLKGGGVSGRRPSLGVFGTLGLQGVSHSQIYSPYLSSTFSLFKMKIGLYVFLDLKVMT